MKLYWHAIVKDEASRIERCMKTLIDHVDGAVVLDTGSTDNTIDLIYDFFAVAGKPCAVGRGRFETWEQARNDALIFARSSDLLWTHLLLVDADMELVAIDPAWRGEILGAPAYETVQKAGTLVYTNARVLSRTSNAVYRGVTHEYLDTPVGGCISGAHFIDHADGANRTGKALRDAALLRGGLEKEPSNGRYWYYLGQSLQDAGEFKNAIPAYEGALKYSTWDEEKWNARVNMAQCYLSLGDRGAYYREILDAFNERPSRAEALHSLARHFREAGKNYSALVFAEEGLRKPLPPDRLFVNAYPYKTGFKEEYAICGYYDPTRKGKAELFNNELSLTLDGDANSRLVARNNMIWYIKPLKDYCPSFSAKKIDFTPPEHWRAMNPSMSQAGDISVRCVNYRITDWGAYEIRNLADGSVNRENPIHTRNFVREYDSTEWREVIWQSYPIGAEDMRIFRWNSELWSISNFRDRNSGGNCEQWLAKLDTDNLNGLLAVNVQKIEPKDFPPTNSEKNWLPWIRNSHGNLCFIHRIGTVLDHEGRLLYKLPASKLDVNRLSGGGGTAYMGNGKWLIILHEAQTLPNESYKRYYYHRFATLDESGKPLHVSRPFVFHEKEIEFAAGIRVEDDKVVISYGRRDEEPWIAKVDLSEVKGLLT